MCCSILLAIAFVLSYWISIQCHIESVPWLLNKLWVLFLRHQSPPIVVNWLHIDGCFTHLLNQPCNSAATHSVIKSQATTVYPKKYAHGFCFAVLCCGYTLTDFPISIRLTSLALGQSNDCPSASKATLMNMDKYFMWIHYERLHNHNKTKHNKTVCIFLGIHCSWYMHLE